MEYDHDLVVYGRKGDEVKILGDKSKEVYTITKREGNNLTLLGDSGEKKTLDVFLCELVDEIKREEIARRALEG